jgi:hypothetical protein
MKTKLTETGFVAVNVLTKPQHMMVWSVAGQASAVRKTIAAAWPERPNSPDGWKNAKRDGVRIRKVKITAL